MGRKLGMTEDDIQRIYRLRREDFPPEEWELLNYVREWAWAGGKEPGGDAAAAVKKFYSPREMRYYRKLMNMMIFANYFSNRFLAGKNRSVDACPLPGSEKSPDE